MPSESYGGWQYPLCKFNGAEMTGLMRRLFGKNNLALEDAQKIYMALMKQSRLPKFYGDQQVADNYDGRIDFLTLHISVVLKTLNKHGSQGQLLSQAIYDVMRDDFEIAMREEGISDAGIKRRIKPMMQLFFTRVKSYVEALEQKSDLGSVFADGLLENAMPDTRKSMETYITQFSEHLSTKTLGEIAMANFSFPN